MSAERSGRKAAPRTGAEGRVRRERPKADVAAQTEPAAPPKLPLKERLKQLVEVYGPIALVVYFALFALTLAGFVVAIRMGMGDALAARLHLNASAEAASTGAVFFFAWAAAKATQPVRIAATLFVTPVVAKLKRRGSDSSRPDGASSSSKLAKPR